MTATRDPIERVHDEECGGVAEALLDQIAQRRPEPQRALELAVRTGYSVGFEIGLVVALTDPVVGRRLREWFARVVQQGDPESHEAVRRQAENWIAGARVAGPRTDA